MIRVLLSCALLVGSIPADGATAGVPDTPPSGTPSSFYVRLDGGRVSMRADQVPLREILQELAREANLVILADESLDTVASVDVDGLPLHRGLRRLLRDCNFMLEYGAASVAAEGVHSGRLWIFGTGPASTVRGVKIRPGRSVAEREERMIVAGEIGGASELALLEAGLSDASSDVREAAVESLADIAGMGSTRLLRQALLSAYPEIRDAAAEFLADRGT